MMPMFDIMPMNMLLSLMHIVYVSWIISYDYGIWLMLTNLYVMRLWCYVSYNI